MKINSQHILMVILVFLTTITDVSAQVFPDGIRYQAVLRNSSGAIINGQTVGVRISILDGSLSGSVLFEEDHLLTTSGSGHIALVVGAGTTTGVGSVGTLSAIDWASADRFMKVMLDENNTSTFVDISTTQLFAVPYAFHSSTSDQQYELNMLTDVDTSGLAIGDILQWDGVNWVASSVDSVSYVDSANYAVNADTAAYVANCGDSWSKVGNALVGGEFIGSTNAADVVFKTNNLERMRVLSSGNVGVGTSAPLAGLQVNSDDGFVVETTHGAGASQVFTGGRLVWYGKKSHFSAGGGTININDASMGDYSTSLGYNVTSSGDYSVAMGNACLSSGVGALSAGYDSKAIGDYSFAEGSVSEARGLASVAMGRQCLAFGDYSIALGYHAEAINDYSVAIGYQCETNADNGFALGYKSSVDHVGAFVFSDASTSSRFYSTAANQFLVRAAGGTTFFSNSALTLGVDLAAGAGAWLQFHRLQEDC